MAYPFLPVLWLWLSAEPSFVFSEASSALRQTAHLERKEINLSDDSNSQKKRTECLHYKDYTLTCIR